MSFYNHWDSKTGVLEVQAVAGIEPGGHCRAPVEKDGRNHHGNLRISWDALGETVVPSWSVPGRGGIAS